METIAYTGAVLTGFMISQTYNYFFGTSGSGNGNGNSGTNPNENAIHTNINIHTHHHTPSIEMERTQKIDEKTRHNVSEPTITIPQSLLYDIQVFPNDELKPVHLKTIPMKLSMEDELKARLSTIRKYVEHENE